ncbi:DUF1850 domain-containing protein [Sulfitobacter sp. LCG007]
MSGACVMVGALAVTLSGTGFDLRWQHSVEKTEWREHWDVAEGRLHLREAAVKGSGAGMDPGPGARLVRGWWVWSPDLPAVPALSLAASGATAGGWMLCDGSDCREYGAAEGETVIIAPCR